MHRLVAVVGLAGSGKSEVVKLFEEGGFYKIYFGGVTMEHIRRLNLEVNEVNERRVRESLRFKHGMAAFAKLSLPTIQEKLSEGNVVIESMYSWEEYTFLKEKFYFLKVVAVFAPPELRYKRLAGRPVRPLSDQDAKSRDYAQIENLHQAGPISMADFTISNTSTIAALIKQTKAIIDEK